MGSLSYSKWACLILALMAVVLIEESLAYKCHHCEDVNFRCVDEECGAYSYAGGIACTTYFYNTGQKEKFCKSKDNMKEILGGEDRCITGLNQYFQEWKAAQEYDYRKANPDPKYPLTESKEEYVKREVDEYAGHVTNIPYLHLDQEITVCTCSTESCNSDANDDKLKEESKDKPKLTSSMKSNGGGGGKSAASTLLADSGNLGAVMFLALAVLAALVPGSGFRRSQ